MARDRRPTNAMAKATPSLGAVTWQRLAWAVEDRLAVTPGSSSALRAATSDAVDELKRRGVPAGDAVAIVRAIVLRLAGVGVDNPRAPSSRGAGRDGIVARAS